MKNRKGFTLVELLVVIVIMGIITGLSIPLIRNLSGIFEEKKYTTYSESLLNAAKLYNDSYSEDLFGHNENGCAEVPYSILEAKKLLKDIALENVSCNSNSTFVRIIKVGDKYSYSPFLGCGKKVNAKAASVDKSLPQPNTVYEMHPEYCTGTGENNLFIAASPTVSDKYDKKRKKVKLSITSGTGINDNMDIGIKWSTVEDDYWSGDYTKIDFKNITNQEKKLLNGEVISTTSDEILTPQNMTGTYYLIVRVNNLTDLYGTNWKNPSGNNSSFLSFGPYKVDNNPPDAELTVTSTNSTYNSMFAYVNINATDAEVATTYTDAQSNLKMCISLEDNNCVPENNYVKKTKVTLASSHDGTVKTVYIAVKDLAGNITRMSTTYKLAVGYYLRYNTQGGTACDPTKKGIAYNTDGPVPSWGELCQTTKDGYAFKEWNTKADGSGTTITSESPVTGMTTVYAQWEPYKTKIYYNINGGELTGEGNSNVSINNSVVYYNGEKYYTEIEYNKKIDNNGLLNYNGSFFSSKRDGYTVPSGKEWYSSSGYYSQSSSNYYSYDFCDASQGDCEVELFINWVQDEEQAIEYTLTYDSNGGTECAPSTITKPAGDVWVDIDKGETYCVPAKENEEFLGWFYGNDSEAILTGDRATSNVTVHAKWALTLKYKDELKGLGKDGKGVCDGRVVKRLPGSIWGPNYCEPELDGYTFKGWFDDNGDQIDFATRTATENINANAKWETSSELTYVTQGGTDCSPNPKKVSYIYGTDAKWGELCTTTRPGYKFKEWNTKADGTGNKVTDITSISGNLSIYAQWEPNECTLKYNSWHGKACSPTTLTKNYGEAWGTLCTPTRTGYKFGGWYTGKDGAGNKITSATLVPVDCVDASIWVYAKWTPRQYSLNYDVDTCSSKEGTYNQPWGDLCAPTKECYSFKNWNKKADGTGEVLTEEDIVKGNLSVYSQWTPRFYTLTYDSKGGTSCDSKIGYFGDTWGELCTPTKTGYTFVGWYNGDNLVTSTTAVSCGNLTVSAKWKANKYKLTYDASSTDCGNSTNCTSKTGTYNQKWGTLCVPNDEHFIFNSWNKKIDGTGSTVTSDTIVKGNLKVYAQCERKQYDLKYHNTPYCTSKKGTYGYSWGELCQPISDGHVFSGWFTGENGTGTEITNDSIVESDLDVYPKWTPVPHTLTYDKDGAVTEVYDTDKKCNPNTITKAYNELWVDSSKGEIACQPTKEHYKFVNWYTEATNGTNINFSTAKVGNEDITIYAHWTPKKYNLTYHGTELCTSKTGTYGHPWGDLCEPVIAGHTFGGWNTKADGTGTEVKSTDIVLGNLDVYLQTDLQKYSLTYHDTEYCTIKYAYYGNQWGTLCQPTKIGYNFGGWFTGTNGGGTEVKSTDIVSRNLDVYPKWTINTYTLTYNSNGGSTCNPNTITKSYNELWFSDSDYCKTTKTGYKFDGWYTSKTGGTKINSTAKATSNITVYAHWTPKEYTLTYHGTNLCTSKKGTYGEPWGDLCNPVESTYTFGGWYTGEHGTGTKITKDSIVNGNLDVYAKKIFTLSYSPDDINPECDGDQIQKVEGETWGKYCDLGQVNSCWFYGWFDSNQHLYFRDTPASNNVTVSSKWATISVLHYKKDDGTPYENNNNNGCNYTKVVHRLGDQAVWGNYCSNAENEDSYCGGFIKNLTSPGSNYYDDNDLDSNKRDLCTPTKTGYDFGGWYTDKGVYSNRITRDTLIPQNCSANIDVYAKWDPKEYTLTYHNNGGEGCTSKQGTYDQKWGTLCTPTREGYTFREWLDANAVPVTSSTIVKGNYRATAMWDANKYTLTYNSNGGTTCSPNKIENKEYDTLWVSDGNYCKPTKTGYKFDGWYTAKTGGTKINFSTAKVQDNITVYAHWTPYVCTITYDANGGVFNRNATDTTQTISYGDSQTIRVAYDSSLAGGGFYNASKEHYYINANSAWMKVGGSPFIQNKEYSAVEICGNNLATGNRSVTFKVNWMPKSYTLTYNNNGGSGCSSITKTYDGGKWVSEWSDVCKPTNNCYTFDNWYTEATGGVKANVTSQIADKNLTVYAHWIRKTPTITCTNNYTVSHAKGGTDVFASYLMTGTCGNHFEVSNRNTEDKCAFKSGKGSTANCLSYGYRNWSSDFYVNSYCYFSNDNKTESSTSCTHSFLARNCTSDGVCSAGVVCSYNVK